MADTKGDDIMLYSVKNVGHSMRNTYKGIYTQSYPIILDFLKKNNIKTQSLFVREDGQVNAELVSPPNEFQQWIARFWPWIMLALVGLGVIQTIRIHKKRSLN